MDSENYYKLASVMLDEEEAYLKVATAIIDENSESSDTSEEEVPKKKRLLVREWLKEKNKGHYNQLLPELLATDQKSYKNFLRMDHDLFTEIEQRLTPRIEKETTNMRAPISPGERLAITLRFLATGDSYKTLSYDFRCANNTIGKIVPETCNAIIEEYMKEVMPCPRNPEEWRNIAENFSRRWQYHNCIGALDGKHIAMKCPNNEGSVYYNYKHFHSIVLLALVDAGHKFIYIDVGANGSASDGGIFRDTKLFKKLEKGMTQKLKSCVTCGKKF